MLFRSQLEREGIDAEDDAQLEQIVLAQRERTKTIREMAVASVFFFRRPTAYDEKAMRKHVTPEVCRLLGGLEHKLAQLTDWSAPDIHAVLSGHATESGVPLGKLAQPTRLAVCGGTISPPIDATLAILGKEESLSRLAAAMARWVA